jgi:gas vesicle protein
METEESLDESSRQIEAADSSKGPGGFAAGLLFGVVLGASFALLFAPEQGQKTRGRLRSGMWSTQKELLRQKRRLRAELERVRERAKEALD